MESGVVPTVVKTGWLNKKGEYLPTWRRRFFVLYSDGSFNGYKEEPTNQMISSSSGSFENTFTVKQSVLIRIDESGFKVRCSQRDNDTTSSGWIERNFQAKTGEERDAWASCIESITNVLSDQNESDLMETDNFNMAAYIPHQLIPKKKPTLSDFQVIKVVGRGTFGNVLLVYKKDDPKQTRMALKLISKKVIRQKEEEKHTENEREVLTIVNHPFLIKLFYAFQSQTHLCFVMEFALGGEIYTHLSRCTSFPISRCRFYGAEIVSAFSYLHSKDIIYRDLKLENLLLDKDGHIKITDFGLCKILNNVDRSTNTFCGTPEYLAPEVLDDNSYGMPVDWWSLGVVLHEMIVGRLPFGQWENHEELYDSICHDTLPELPPRVPHDAGSFLRGLLIKQPGLRLGSHGDAREVMEHHFFATIDWDALERREIQPEFVPCIRDRDDVQYFDNEFTQLTPTRVLPGSQSVTSEAGQEFPNFSFNNEHRSHQDQVMA